MSPHRFTLRTFVAAAVYGAASLSVSASDETLRYPIDNWLQTCDFAAVCLTSNHLGDDAIPGSGPIIDTLVVSPANGIVREAQEHQGYGGTVIIEADSSVGKVTILLGHLRWSPGELLVSPGQSITRGTPVGRIAPKFMNGGDFNPHVHIGIHKGAYQSVNLNCNGKKEWIYAGRTDCPAEVFADWYDPSDFIQARLFAPPPTASLLNFETSATGLNIVSAPVVTDAGTIAASAVGGHLIVLPGGVGTGNILLHDKSVNGDYGQLAFSFDVSSVTFNFTGYLAGQFSAQVLDSGFKVLDSFFDPDTENDLPGGPVTLSGSGIRFLRFTDTDPTKTSSGIDNVSISVAPVSAPGPGPLAWSPPPSTPIFISPSGTIGTLVVAGLPATVMWEVIHTNSNSFSMSAGGGSSTFVSAGDYTELSGISVEDFYVAPSAGIGDGTYTIYIFTNVADWVNCNSGAAGRVPASSVSTLCVNYVFTTTFSRSGGVWSQLGGLAQVTETAAQLGARWSRTGNQPIVNRMNTAQDRALPLVEDKRYEGSGAAQTFSQRGRRRR